MLAIVVDKKLTELSNMYQFSDSDSVDSDEGIRYKTESIRNKNRSRKADLLSGKVESYHSHRERRRSTSPRYREHDRQKVKTRKKEYLPKDEERKDSKKISSRSKTKDNDRKHKEREKNKRKLHKENSTYQVSTGSTSSVELVTKTNENPNFDYEGSAPFGPVLPPKIHKSLEINSGNFITDNENQTVNPELPVHTKETLVDNAQNEENKLINSVLPPHFVTVSSLEDDSNDEKIEFVGPDLPPHLMETRNNVEPTLHKNIEKSHALEQNFIVGPALPPHLLPKVTKKHDEGDNYSGQDRPLPSNDPVDVTIGPAIPTHLREKLLEQSSIPGKSIVESKSDDDDIYGPIPIGENYSKAHIELEERALKMKMDQLEPAKDKQPGREEWMLTLPEAKAASFGVGPRQFRAKAGPDLSDRSSWTDTPEDKAKRKAGKIAPKIDLQREAELKEIKKRDKEQEAIAKKNKKHKESLLDIHVKKIKNEKKDDSGSSERRPFSREIDLQVNKFDEAQKKAVLKKAQLLDTRFSTGESKFL